MAYIIFIVSLIMMYVLRKTTKLNRVLTAITTVTFVTFLAFSINIGPDYYNYETLYNYTTFVPLRNIHGEIGFNYVMSLFANNNFDYQIFREVYLTAVLLMISIAIYKNSENFELSILLIFFGYIVYLVSGIRQTFVIMVVLLLYNDIKEKNHKKVILLTLLSGLFHISGIYVSGLYFLMIWSMKIFKHFNITMNKITYYFLIFIGLIVRVLAYYTLKTLNLNLGTYLNVSSLELFSLGLLSRVIITLIFIYFSSKLQVKTNNALKLYLISNIIYIIIPYPLAAGRLFNNFKVLEVLLINELLINRTNKEKLIIITSVLTISISIFLYQIYGQGSYLPYSNNLINYITG